MRISTMKDCPWYRSNADRFIVRFNGKLVPASDLLLADSETGLLVTIKRDRKGKPVYRNDDTVSVIEMGTVTIEAASAVRASEAEVACG